MITITKTGVVYRGTYDSSVSLSYTASTDTWVVVSSNNLLLGEPVCNPSSAPSAAPSASPTSRPTASNHSQLDIYMYEVSGSGSWDGVQLVVLDPSSSVFFVDAPSFGSNPKNGTIYPSDPGFYSIGATFPGSVPPGTDVRDLQCRVSTILCCICHL